MIRKVSVSTIMSRLFQNEDMLSSNDFLHVLPYRVMKILNRDLKIDKVKIAGNTLYLDEHDSLNLAWYRVYEPFETKFVLSQINPGEIVLDLGAFIGYYTILFADKVGPKGKVVAFEPSPMSFKTLSKNIEVYNSKNRFDSFSIEQKAVTEHSNEKVLLHLCNENYGMNRIYPSKYTSANANKIEVETIRVDDYFQNYISPINFVKMDLEGSEYGALKGMEEIIHKNKGIKILIEFHPDSIREYGKDPKDMFELLYSYGLTVYHLNKITKEIEIIRPVISNTTVRNKHTLTMDKFIDLANRDTTNLFCQKTSS